MDFQPSEPWNSSTFPSPTGPAHPYYPLDINIAQYSQNTWPVFALLGTFATACSIAFSATYLLAKRIRPTIPRAELLTVMWFVLCGCIHLFFEGFFVAFYKELASSQHPIGQMWKEYALSDSRYLTEDVLVLCVEAFTAIFWGPLSLTVAGLIIVDHPLRHPLQALVSLGQLYGDMLYYATSMYDHYFNNIAYSRPEWYYFWGYYFLMNFFWIIIPAILLCSSVATTRRAFEKIAQVEGIKKKQ